MTAPTDPDLDAALAVARDALHERVPDGLADRAVAAALAAPRPARTWWTAAFPVAWRASISLAAVAAAIVGWTLTRPAPVANAKADPVGAMIDDEASAVLAGVLRAPRRTP